MLEGKSKLHYIVEPLALGSFQAMSPTIAESHQLSLSQINNGNLNFFLEISRRVNIILFFPYHLIVMKEIFSKTFGGLTKQYLARQLFFGVAMAALFITMMQNRPNGIGLAGMLMFVVNAALYPYSRFVYESIVNFIVGENFFLLPAIPMLIAKCFTMLMCFALALFIAPIGLAYLYFRHSRA